MSGKLRFGITAIRASSYDIDAGAEVHGWIVGLPCRCDGAYIAGNYSAPATHESACGWLERFIAEAQHVLGRLRIRLETTGNDQVPAERPAWWPPRLGDVIVADGEAWISIGHGRLCEVGGPGLEPCVTSDDAFIVKYPNASLASPRRSDDGKVPF